MKVTQIESLLKDWGGITPTHSPSTCNAGVACGILEWQTPTHRFTVYAYDEGNWFLAATNKLNYSLSAATNKIKGGDNQTAIEVLAKMLELAK